MMNELDLFSSDSTLWDPETKSKWRLHDFCPIIYSFHIEEITKVQISHLSQDSAWGEGDKPRGDMVLLLFMPVIVTGPDTAFSFVDV